MCGSCYEHVRATVKAAGTSSFRSCYGSVCMSAAGLNPNALPPCLEEKRSNAALVILWYEVRRQQMCYKCGRSQLLTDAKCTLGRHSVVRYLPREFCIVPTV